MFKKFIFGSMETVITVLIYAVVVFVIIKASTFAYGFSYEIFGSKAADPKDTTAISLVVSEGMTADDIGKKLEELGVAKYGQSLAWKMKLSKTSDKIVPATYTISKAMPLDYVAQLIITGIPKDETGNGLYLVKQDVNRGEVIEDESLSEGESQSSEGSEQ